MQTESPKSLAQDIWTWSTKLRQTGAPLYFDKDECLKDRGLYAKGNAMLADLQSLRNAVETLLSTVDHKISGVRAAVVPASRFYGLAAIPDEILTAILEAVGKSYLSEWFVDDDGTKVQDCEYRGFLLVSKRFNACARATKQLLVVPAKSQTITLTQASSMASVTAIANRSKVTKAIVRVGRIHDHPGAREIKLLSYLSQLQYLCLTLWVRADPDYTFTTDKAISLPELKGLSIRLMDKGHDADYGPVTLGWFSLPKLIELRLGYGGFVEHASGGWEDVDFNDLLQEILDIASSSEAVYGSVRHLELIEMGDNYAGWGGQIMNLSPILGAFPNIFSLTLQGCHWIEYRLEESDLPIKLENLRHLRLETRWASHRNDLEPVEEDIDQTFVGFQKVFGVRFECVSVRSEDDKFFGFVRESFPTAVRVPIAPWKVEPEYP